MFEKNTKIKNLISLFLMILMFSGIAKADEKTDNSLTSLDQAANTENLNLSEEEKSALKDNLILNELNERLFTTQRFYQNLEGKIEKTKDKLDEMKVDVDFAKNDLAYLNMQIQETTRKVNGILQKIIVSESEMEKKFNAIEAGEIQYQEQLKLVSSYLFFIYFNQNNYLDDNNNLNMLKLLLSDKTVSQTMEQQTYLKILEEHGSEVLKKLNEMKKKLEKEKTNLEIERAKSTYLKSRLDSEQKILKEEQENKENLLNELKEKQDIFQQMLSQSMLQKELAEKEIAALHNNIKYFDERLALAKNTLTEQEYAEVLKIKEEMTAKGIIDSDQQFKFDIWPIVPSDGLSAYFDDLNYKARFGVDHRAIDIRAPQGTPIRAPADGIVLKAVDNGLGYNYIVMAFRHNILAVFGHVSKIFVETDENTKIEGENGEYKTFIEGQFIRQGEVIGLSGGTIGLPGSGLRTTGPHLHFEVWEKGVKVDPLQYLPIEYLPIEYIPTEYLKNLDMGVLEIMKELK